MMNEITRPRAVSTTHDLRHRLARRWLIIGLAGVLSGCMTIGEPPRPPNDPALARQLTARAALSLHGETAGDLVRGALLAMESLRLDPTQESYDLLIEALHLLPRFQSIAWPQDRERATHSAFSPDSRYLAAATDNPAVRVWRTSDGREVVRIPTPSAVSRIAFSPDSRRLAASTPDGVVLWDLAGGQDLGLLPHQEALQHLAFSPKGRYLVTAGPEKITRVWEVASGRELWRLNQEIPGRGMAFDPEDRHLAVASPDHAVRIWTIADRRQRLHLGV